jgi:hypothetical protein
MTWIAREVFSMGGAEYMTTRINILQPGGGILTWVGLSDEYINSSISNVFRFHDSVSASLPNGTCRIFSGTGHLPLDAMEPFTNV